MNREEFISQHQKIVLEKTKAKEMHMLNTLLKNEELKKKKRMEKEKVLNQLSRKQLRKNNILKKQRYEMEELKVKEEIKNEKD